MIIADLIQRCRAGEANAIQQMVLEHQQSVYRLALSILDDPAEADEATQDVFLAAIEGLPSYRGEAAFSTWLYSIALNLCRRRLRRRQARQHLMTVLQALFQGKNAGEVHPEETVVRREADEAVFNAIQSLGEKHRLPIVLFYYHGYSVAEIGELLGIREGTVLSRLFTARERLRGDLGESILSEFEPDDHE